MILPVAGSLALILLLVSVWQRQIEKARRAGASVRLEEARSLGADKPVGQYPHVDALRCMGCGSCVKACPEDGVLALVGGIAHVVAAAKCIGHGLCEKACPVGAITVGLGDISSRPDIPVLTEEFETTVPGVYIAGELGGLALIRHAVGQGVLAVNAAARRAEQGSPVAGMIDLLIVGAGPCGMAASLRARELGLDYRTIDMSDLGGTIRKYPRRKLVLTEPVSLPFGERLRRREYRKEELVEFWEETLARRGVTIESGVKLLGIERGDCIEAKTSAGDIRCRTLLLALGRRGTPRKLGVPGEEQEKVFYQLVDAATYEDMHLLVVGGGDSAVEAAMALAEQRGNRVTLSYRKSDFFRLKSRNEKRIREQIAAGQIDAYFSSEVRAIGEREVALEIAGGERSIPNDFAFVFAGGEPPFPLLRQSGIALGGDR